MDIKESVGSRKGNVQVLYLTQRKKNHLLGTYPGMSLLQYTNESSRIIDTVSFPYFLFEMSLPTSA